MPSCKTAYGSARQLCSTVRNEASPPRAHVTGCFSCSARALSSQLGYSARGASATPPVRISRTLRGVSVNSQCAPAGTYPKRSYRWRWPPSMAMSQPAACIRSCASCISKARCPLPRLRPSTHTVPMPPTRRAVPAMLKSCIFRQYSPAGAPSSYSTVCSGALSAPGPYSLGSSVGKSTFPSGVRNASSANAKSSCSCSGCACSR